MRCWVSVLLVGGILLFGAFSVVAESELVFISDRTGNLDVYTMNLDGSNVIPLTDDSATDRIPVWSRDGTRIAFSSNRSGTSQVWIMSADGTDLAQVTDVAGGIFDGSSLSWYPDDARIAFIGSDRSVYTVSADGSDGTTPPKLIAAGTGTFPDIHGMDISPDGSLILIKKAKPGWGHDNELFIADASGTILYQLTSTPLGDKQESQDGRWSPTGDLIAFEGIRYSVSNDKNIFLINPDTTGLTNLTDVPPVAWSIMRPSWSPDASMLVASGKAYSSDFEIYIIDAATGLLVNISNTSSNEYHADWRWGSGLVVSQLTLKQAAILEMMERFGITAD